MGGDVEADLVVALAGAAVGDRVGAFLVGDLDQQLGDHRSGHGRGQRVDALVQGAGLDVRPAEVTHEPLASVDDVGARRAGADGSPIDVLLENAAPEVDRQGHDLDVVLLAQPGDGDRRVESAGIGEHHLLHRGASVSVKGSTAGSAAAPAGWKVWKRTSHRCRAASVSNSTSSVLSPASVPTWSCQARLVDRLGDGSRGPRGGHQNEAETAPPDADGDVLQETAQPGVVEIASGRALGRGVDVAVAARHLDQAQLRGIAADRGLGDLVAGLAEQLNEFLLAADRRAGDELQERALPRCLTLMRRR